MQITRRDLKQVQPKYWKRSINYCDRYNLLYLTNQKAGCSTIKLWLQRLELDDPAHIPPNSNIHVFGDLQGSASGARRPDIGGLLGGKAFVFSFVRHPAARIASAYRDKMNRETRQHAEIARILGRPEGLETAISFDDFLTAIETMNPALMDPHWRPQHINLYHGLVEPAFVGRLERFADDMSELQRLRGLPLFPIVTRHRTTRTHAIDDEITPPRRKRIEALFARDFEIYGYE